MPAWDQGAGRAARRKGQGTRLELGLGRKGNVMINGLQTVRRILGYGSAAVAAAAVSYATYAAVTWARYGRVHPDRFPRDDLLDRFLPRPEVDICHRIRVDAPAAATFAVAREFDLQRSPVVRVILMLRTLPSLLRGEPLRGSSRGVVAWTLAMGWVVLAEVPDREIVVGTVTQPWEPVAPFHTLPPEEFAAFNEPGYAKIVYILAADPLGTERVDVLYSYPCGDHGSHGTRAVPPLLGSVLPGQPHYPLPGLTAGEGGGRTARAARLENQLTCEGSPPLSALYQMSQCVPTAFLTDLW